MAILRNDRRRRSCMRCIAESCDKFASFSISNDIDMVGNVVVTSSSPSPSSADVDDAANDVVCACSVCSVCGVTCCCCVPRAVAGASPLGRVGTTVDVDVEGICDVGIVPVAVTVVCVSDTAVVNGTDCGTDCIVGCIAGCMITGGGNVAGMTLSKCKCTVCAYGARLMMYGG